MDKKTQNRRLGPDYQRIYRELIQKKFPESLPECETFLNKGNLTFFEIKALNDKLFGIKSREQQLQEQRYRSYDTQTILRMLRYQKKHGLTNTQLADHFKLSRNTVNSWIKTFGKPVKDSQ